MGFIFSKMFGKLFGKKDIRILILGLDNAGKTTILNKLHLNDVVQTIPSIFKFKFVAVLIHPQDSMQKLLLSKTQNSKFGIQVVRVVQGFIKYIKIIQFIQLDLTGDHITQIQMELYMLQIQSIKIDQIQQNKNFFQCYRYINKAILSTPKSNLYVKIKEEELKGVPLMVLANKQDLAGAQSEEKISEFMGLTNIQDRQWSIFKCSAFTGHGLNEGMDWLVNVLESQK